MRSASLVKVPSNLLERDQRQNYDGGDEAGDHADEADRRDDDDRGHLGCVAVGEVLPAKRVGQAVAAGNGPQQIAGPQRPAHAQDREGREQRRRRPWRPGAAGMERQRIEEIPPDAETADQGRREQQHDAGEGRAERDPRDAERRTDVFREQQADAGHARHEPQGDHPEAVQRHHRVEPLGGQRGEVSRLHDAHHEAEDRQDREQHEGDEHPRERQAREPGGIPIDVGDHLRHRALLSATGLRPRRACGDGSCRRTRGTVRCRCRSGRTSRAAG